VEIAGEGRGEGERETSWQKLEIIQTLLIGSAMQSPPSWPE
jgi:hypothetical protein